MTDAGRVAFFLGHVLEAIAEVIAQRNLLSHGYFAVDMELVWTTLKRDLPALRKAIAGLLP